MYPTVGLQTPGEVVDANFGQMPFVYDIEEVLKVKSWIRLLLAEPEIYFLGMALGSLRKQMNFPPVALRRRKIPSAKPIRKKTSLTLQDFDQSKFSSQKPRSNVCGAYAKTCKNMALAQPIAKSVRFSQASD